MTIQETISQRALLSSIRHLIGDNPDPDNPTPPGPWDPVIRWALPRVLWIFEPNPDPWRRHWLFEPNPEPWVLVGLNPQPLPPRVMFFSAIAQFVIGRALSIQETANAIRGQGERQSTVGGSAYISRFVDDFCGTGRRVGWPFPPPRPKWFTEDVAGRDLVVTGMQFEKAASQSYGFELKQVFADAGAKLTAVGLSRLQ